MMGLKLQKDAKKFMPVFFILFLVYTIMYHVLMWDALTSDATEEECAAQAHAGGILPPQCLELEVFRDWHKKGVEDLLREAPASKTKVYSGEALEKPLSGKVAVVVDESGETYAQKISDDLASLEKKLGQLVVSSVYVDVKHDSEKQDSTEEIDLQKRLEQRKERLDHFNKLEQEVRESLKVTSVSPWAKDLDDLREHMEQELHSHKSIHHAHGHWSTVDDEQLASHRQAELDRLELSVNKALSSNATTPWARDLELAKSRLAYKLATHTHKFHGSDASAGQTERLQKLEASLNDADDDSHETPWSRELKKLQQRLEFEMHTHTHHHHGPEEAAQQAAQWGLFDEASTKTSDAAESDPLNRWTSDIKKFHTTHAEFQAKHEKRVAQRAELTKEIAARMDKLEHGLAHLVSDRKAWEASLLNKYDVANITGHHESAASAEPKSTFMSKRLQWSNVPSFAPYKSKNSEEVEAAPKQPVVVSKKEVRHLPWTGDLPKVAAIAWIKGDRKTRARMTYFVDNFRLQDYKGSRQLVLVYHYKDVEAAQILRRFVNDSDVTVVAAHDYSLDVFPSDPALRYAAWASEADIVAQWDFDAWHDPSRLNLQLRAMAHSGRHACVLSMSSTSHTQEDEGKEISLSSILGERAWMREHWHPFSKRILEINETFKAGQLVELDMENKKMMNSISRIEHVFTEPEPESPVKKAQEPQAEAEGGTKFSRDISECLGYDTSKGHEGDDAAEKAIRENVGPEFGKKFHDLAKKRRDITLKLQLLCFQASMEKDAGKRKFMHEHVLEMDRIRLELDKHVKHTATLFGVSDFK